MDLVKDIKNRVRHYSPVWEEWTIGPEIGNGNYSAVFSISSEDKRKKVVKVITIEADEKDANQLEKFSEELERLRKLEGCQNIISFEEYAVKILRSSEKKLLGYDFLLRMRYLPSLRSKIQKNCIFTEEDVIKLGIEITRALSEARRKGIFHGNISPSNIFLLSGKRKEYHYYLADFESCILKGGSEREGDALHYMAPEVYEKGNSGSLEEDIYSLGVILFQLLNDNRVPFEKNSDSDTFIAENKKTFPALQRNLQSDIDEVAVRCCSYQENVRYHSLDELERDLKLCKGQLTKQLPEEKKIEDKKQNQKNHKKYLYVLAAGAAVIILGAAFFWKYGKNRINSEKPVVGTESIAAVPASAITPSDNAAQTVQTTEEARLFEAQPEVQKVYYSQNLWQEEDIASENETSLGNNEIGFADLDQDGTLEFIYGYAVKKLNGVDSEYYIKYHIYSLTGEQPQLIGSTNTLKIYFNPQESRNVFFSNVYTEGIMDETGFSGIIDSDVTGLSNGVVQTRKMFQLVRSQGQMDTNEERMYYTYDDAGNKQEISYSEYNAGLNEFTQTLQPATTPLDYEKWDTSWSLEEKQQVILGVYNKIKQ